MIVSPTATSTLQPPACSFPLANVKYLESKPEEYTFSEPQVVLTAPEGNPLNVAGWLPDNQQILMTEELRNQYVESNDTAIQETISLYNLDTGESKLYATRNTGGSLVWLPDTNGVVYSSANYTHIDKEHGDYKYTRQLRVSYGDPDATQLLADNLTQKPLVKPDGSEILYLSGKQVSKLNKSLKKLPSVSFDPAQWDYAKVKKNNEPISYGMAWQPGTSLVFLNGGGGDYTFILDTATGYVCELNLGEGTGRAYWSPDGRYLAIAKLPGVVILDSMTGNLRTVGATLPDAEGNHYVGDFTWTPDSLHLLAFVNIPSHYDVNRFETHYYDLYLIDLASDQSTHLFPEFKSFNGRQNNFVWSPNGSRLLVPCPVIKYVGGTDRYCLINIQSAK
jgi:Tol biopolymer transport system component